MRNLLLAGALLPLVVFMGQATGGLSRDAHGNLVDHNGTIVQRAGAAPQPPVDRAALVELRGPKIVARLVGCTDATISMAFSPDGRKLAAGGGDKIVRVWSMPDGKELWHQGGNDDLIYDVVWSPDGSKLVSTDRSGEILVWDAAKGELVDMFKQTCPAVWAAFAPDSKNVVAVCGESLKFYAPGQADPVRVIDIGFDPGTVAFSPKGLIAAVPRKSNQFVILNEATGELVTSHGRPSAASAVGGVESPNYIYDVHFLGEDLYIADNTGTWRWQRAAGAGQRDKITFLYPSLDGSVLPVLDGRAIVSWANSDLSVTTVDYAETAAFQSELTVARVAYTPTNNLLAVSCGWGFDAKGDWSAVGPRVIRVYSLDDLMQRAATKKEGSQYRQHFAMPTPAPVGWE